MAPSAVQSVVMGSTTVMSPLDSGLTLISQRMLLPLTSRRAPSTLRPSTVPRVTVKAWSRSVIESTFRAAFRSIRDQLPQRDLVNNIIKRAEEVGMKDYLPADLQQTLEALFRYRNDMFHGGFEWAPENLKAFKKELDRNHWPTEWFSKATSDDEPWMFYMTPTFIDHCLKIAEAVVSGVEKFTFERTFNS